MSKEKTSNTPTTSEPEGARYSKETGDSFLDCMNKMLANTLHTVGVSSGAGACQTIELGE